MSNCITLVLLSVWLATCNSPIQDPITLPPDLGTAATAPSSSSRVTKPATDTATSTTTPDISYQVTPAKIIEEKSTAESPIDLTPTSSLEPDPTTTILPDTATPLAQSSIRIAVIGDYGLPGRGQESVSALVKSWRPDFIITTGDNNYPDGAAETIDENIGQYYSEYLFPYQGSYNTSGTENRFYPSPGNHDWNLGNLDPYLNYFTLPGNERYYDFRRGPVHLFSIDSDSREPDGISATSVQAQWLKSQLAASDAPWKVVYMHHPPYSSASHGSVEWMRWPFKEWGATTVLAGHDHVYERLMVGDFPYFINGLGGTTRYNFPNPLPGSQVRYQLDHGAMLIQADHTQITFQFMIHSGELIDSYTLNL